MAALVVLALPTLLWPSSRGASTATPTLAPGRTLRQSPEGDASPPPTQGPPLFVSYAAAGGAANQLYGHINALAVGLNLTRAGLNITLVTNSAQSRKNSTLFRDALTQYDQQPLDSMVDWARMQVYWEPRGLRLQRAANTSQCVYRDLVNYKHRMNITQMDHYPAPLAFSMLREAVENGTTGPVTPPCVHLFLGNPIVLLNHPSSWPYQLPAVHGLFFPPDVQQAADEVLSAMTGLGHPSFFGLHLRLEDDYIKYAGLLKGKSPLSKQDPLGEYIRTMKAANFTQSAPVYVASGLFISKPPAEIKALEDRLRAEGVLGTMLHKQQLLEPTRLAGFHTEQLALIDLLVMLKAQVLVGDDASSFSAFAREYRAMQGIPKGTYFSVAEYPLPSPCREDEKCEDINQYSFCPPAGACALA
ncbi:hypothetical protein N2152v2_010373 [Parachlorella kessleri]